MPYNPAWAALQVQFMGAGGEFSFRGLTPPAKSLVGPSGLFGHWIFEGLEGHAIRPLARLDFCGGLGPPCG